jgi:N-acetylmuramoyl-L-alanine amidase
LHAGVASAHARIGGHDYVRVTELAKTAELEFRWLKRDEKIQLSNRTSKWVLDVDSRQAEFNGLQVWLSFPVVQFEGWVYLAKLDVDTTIRPLLSPPRNSPNVKLHTICLDPGHGGKDPGFSVGASQEKKYTLLLAQEVRQQLARAGLKATLTRSTDAFIELPDRPDLAHRQKADLFVSLHFNSTEADRSSVKGAQVFCLTPAGANSTNTQGEGGSSAWCAGNGCNDRSICLAYQVQKALTSELGVEDRGVRRARYAVLRDAVMPAVLIEGGFLSHPVEGKKILTAAYRKEMARAIVDGLLAYKRAVEQ